MSRFDTFLMVDWSGGNDRGPRPVADAIWTGVARAGQPEEPVYHRNRQVAEDWITRFLAAERAMGRRVLAGFDFPFGYPTGLADTLVGTGGPLALWHWLEERIEDAPKANNRFDLAAEINRRYRAAGPFWANALARDIPDLPRRKPPIARTGLAERRKVETRAKGSFTVWQLAGAGSVGSQVLMGLPVLARLRDRFASEISVWPFEPLTGAIALVEIWPSLFVGPTPGGIVKDAWQVREVARILSALPDEDLLQMLCVDAPEEGWILGVGHEERLRCHA